jgi:hypothetical protein
MFQLYHGENNVHFNYDNDDIRFVQAVSLLRHIISIPNQPVSVHTR